MIHDPALPLMIAAPLAGFVVNGLAGRRLGVRLAGWVGCAAAFGGFLIALRTYGFLVAISWDEFLRSTPVATWAGPMWFEAGGLRVSFLLRLDPLSSTMTLVVTGVGFLIHVYSLGYMKGDPGFARYFAYLNLFLAMMLVLVLAGNLPLLFLGWEGVGLCSYLLIGFWHRDLKNARAGKKAFLVNRVGDLGFLLAMLVLFRAAGTLDLHALLAPEFIRKAGPGLLAAAGALLFLGAVGKSAQIPLFIWLPDAMAGPTPVSALIHAATMVTAGVYMVARLHPIFAAADPALLQTIGWTGGATALLAASAASAQTDIKRVLAYSTVSQLGLMFLALGACTRPGDPNLAAAPFHLVTHAFFKALLFLSAGAVIHGLSGVQDLRRMGGLARTMPGVAAATLAGGLALAGIPPFAGFWSKEGILAAAGRESPGLWGLGLGTTLLTAFYMTRLFCLAFLGSPAAPGEPAQGHDPRGAAHGAPHKTPPSMGIPLAILAFLSAGAGWLFLGHHAFSGWLDPAFRIGLPEPDPRPGIRGAVPEGLLLPGALGAAGFGLLAGILRYARRPAIGEPAGLRRALFEAWGFDRILSGTAVRVFEAVSFHFWLFVDRILIDMVLVGGAAALARRLAAILRRLQAGPAGAYAAAFAAGAAALLWIAVRS